MIRILLVEDDNSIVKTPGAILVGATRRQIRGAALPDCCTHNLIQQFPRGGDDGLCPVFS